MERPHARWTVVLMVASSLTGFFPACAKIGGSVEVDQPADPPDPVAATSEYAIGIGDLLSIQVWGSREDVGQDARP